MSKDTNPTIKEYEKAQDVFLEKEGKLKLKDLDKFINSLPKYLFPVGSVFRAKQQVGDVDLITTKNLNKILKYFEDNYGVKIEREGEKILFFDIDVNGKNVEINIWHATKDEFPFLYFARTYPRQFNIEVRANLKRKGYKLSDYKLTKGKEIITKFIDLDNKERTLIHPKDFFDFFQSIGYDKKYRSPQEEDINDTGKEVMAGNLLSNFVLNRIKNYALKKGQEYLYENIIKPVGISAYENIIKPVGETIYEGTNKVISSVYGVGSYIWQSTAEPAAYYSFQKIANAYRARYGNGKSRPLEYGEIHPFLANFIGPGTSIDKKENLQYEPINLEDLVAKIHDIEYGFAFSEQDEDTRSKLIRQADDDMIERLNIIKEKNKQTEPYWTLARNGINGKIVVEDYLPKRFVKYFESEYYGEDK